MLICPNPFPILHVKLIIFIVFIIITVITMIKFILYYITSIINLEQVLGMVRSRTYKVNNPGKQRRLRKTGSGSTKRK